MFIKGLTLDQNPTFSWIQWPIILFYVVMYLVYLFFSIKYRRSPMKLKFCTYFYMVVLLAIFTVSAGIMMMTRRNIVSILSGAMFLLSIYYLIRTVPRKLKEAVQNQTEFSPMVALVTEKISDVRGSIDAVLMPIMPAIFVFATYVFSIDLLRGYYLFKYSEQYREQFDYSVKDWYGEKSKEYRRMQG